MARDISQLAVVDPRAEIDDDVQIGPFSMIGPDVRIGSGTRIANNVTIMGKAALGERNQLYPGVVIGGEPQDITCHGDGTEVAIGDDNIFRECVTVNRGSEKEEGITLIGDHNFLMACSHVAHDCRMGSHIILTNNCLLGGHVHVHDHVTLSGAVAVHHFATLGSYCFVAGVSAVRHDIPPYMLAEGYPARPRCVNVVALRRNGFPADVINSLAEAHRLLYRAKVGLDNAREILRGNGHLIPQVNHLLGFVQNQQEGRHGRGRERRQAA